ncbi:MAG: patatin-like phospholipase family protein, partial [Pseudorhodoplanes sp.]
MSLPNATLRAFSALLLIGTLAGGAVATSAGGVSAASQDVSAQRKKPAKKPAPKPKPGEFPARENFTAEEQKAAAIPGMPDARFWSDSVADFKKAIPDNPGPWLVLSSGGGDGAFGAGLLNGWSETGDRPEFSVVTGVSTGALMAPYAFLGPKYDAALKENYTTINAGSIFEAGGKGESFLDTWPLKELIAKLVDENLLAAIAAEHQRGRRLLVLTTNLDAERYVVWNMGAIASRGGEAALKLFRNILLAS